MSTYTEVSALFLRYMNLKQITKITTRAIEQFNYDFIYSAQKSVSYQNQCISGIKQYMEFNGILVESLHIERPQKDKKLSNVLSKEEVRALFEATRNLKHKTLLSLIYSAGLCISELINLELRDINIDRKQILIRRAKGRKDLYVMLSEGFLPLWRNYVVTYKPQKYFVEGNTGQKYSDSIIRKFINRSCQAANIHKKVTPHTLRHSYAMHLLENGVDVRYIQMLLGHACPETTMIYTHVSKKELLQISSSLGTVLKGLIKPDKNHDLLMLSGNLV